MDTELYEMLELSSDIRQMPKVESFVENIVERYDVGPDVYGNILISLTEAVTNAIVHGNASNPIKQVKVRMEKVRNKLIFKVTDQGGGFDFNTIPDPTAPENLLKVGGRGVFMMKQLCDLVVFSEEGSTVEMQFKI